MAHHELEGQFTVTIPGTNPSEVIGLVLDIAFDGKTSRGKLRLSRTMSRPSRILNLRDEVRLSRVVPSMGVTEYFRVTRQEPDTYEVCIMGGKPTPLGRRIRAEFEEAFGTPQN